MNKLPKRIYCDFDGTVTKKDAVNTFFEQFADPKWIEYEKQWIKGEISSRENAIAQVALIREMPLSTLNKYIDSIEIDEYFKEFVDYTKSIGTEIVILSDGFDLFIEKTLEKYDIKGVKFFANHLIYENNKFKIEFPYYNENCDIKAGMCKCSRVKDEKFWYIGDGTSDLCVAKKADILFASKVLKNYCKNFNLNHIPFDDFSIIIDYVKNLKKI